MHILPKFALQAACVFALAQAASASVVINILANRLDNESGTAVAAGTLVQLVNLGADGVFNPINVDPAADSNTTGIARWVSGDDTVLNIAFTTTVGGQDLPGDFASTAAFDLSHSQLTESTLGRFNRTFIFEFGAAGLPQGVKLGLRWFSGLKAADYYAGTGINLQVGQAYGQFTRQVTLRINNNEFWVSPGDGSSITFDSLVTADSSATAIDPDPATAGDALLRVLPEPASVGLSMIGVTGLALLRRRRRA